jgi:hypothetical protein
MLTVRDAIPKARELATAEFATLRLRPLKIAARVVETAMRILSPSPPHVPKPTSSAACPARCSCSARKPTGPAPDHPTDSSNASITSLVQSPVKS